MKVATRVVPQSLTEVTLSGAELGRIIAAEVRRRLHRPVVLGGALRVGMFDADRQCVTELPDLTVVVLDGPAELPRSI